MPKPIAESELEAAKAELEKVRKEWLRRPGVTAVDVGYKIKDKRMTDEIAIRVHVKRKRRPEELSASELFPKHRGRFSVDVVEAEYGPQTAE